MTFSKFEFYGGSKHTELSIASPSYTIGYGDSTRVLYFTELDALPLGTVDLPDATKIRRQDGFLFYLIVNDMSVDIELRDFVGGLVTTIDAGKCGGVGRQDVIDSAGRWFVDEDDCIHDPPPVPPPPTVSFGGAFLNHDTWLYFHDVDSWLQAANTPVDSHFAQAVNVLQLVGGAFRSYWKHLLVHYEFSFGADTHTAVQSSTIRNEQTGSARLRDGDGIESELYLSWGSLTDENIPIIYHPVGDVWTSAATLLNAGATQVLFNRCVTSAGEFTTPAGPSGTWLTYMITAEPTIDPDSPENPYFWAYQGTSDTHFQLPMVPTAPVPPNRWQASMVNLDQAVHVVGGSIVVASPNIPQDASARHLRYSGGFGGDWVARPQLPEPVMGMGIEIHSEVVDKFTLGMGEAQDGINGSAQHFEYDETTQSYTARSVANWFQKNSQEGSWCVAGA